MACAPPRVGISRCLLGERCRYDGGDAQLASLHLLREAKLTLLPVCPEVTIGLPVPREKLLLVGPREAPALIGAQSGRDHTDALRALAGRFIDEARLAGGLHGFILKSRSPSCGMGSVWRREHPATEPLRDGTGLFARALLARLPALPAAQEGDLDDAAAHEAFLARVQAYASRDKAR